MKQSCPCPTPQPIVIRWGDTRVLVAAFTLSGAPADLTGATVVLTIANQELGVREVFSSAGMSPPVTIDVGASTATCTVATAALQNCRARYAFSWRLTDVDGNVTTTEESCFEVLPSL
jgi:hypothetical protein